MDGRFDAISPQHIACSSSHIIYFEDKLFRSVVLGLEIRVILKKVFPLFSSNFDRLDIYFTLRQDCIQKLLLS